MKRFIKILYVFSIIGCSHSNTDIGISEKEKEEFKTDTRTLKILNDSLNSTGDYKYYEKYIILIDDMIVKYPDQKQLLKVKESMKEIYD